jgi:2-haloacid dehalogenase
MTYRAPSTGLTVRAVLFDVFGTVVDWRSGIAAAVRSFADGHGLELDSPAFADSWRGRYQPAMQLVRSGARPFASLDVLHRENLDDTLRELGLSPGGFAPGELELPGLHALAVAPKCGHLNWSRRALFLLRDFFFANSGLPR